MMDSKIDQEDKMSFANEWYERFPFLKGHVLDQVYRTLVQVAVSKRDLKRLMGMLDPKSRLLRKEFQLLEGFYDLLRENEVPPVKKVEDEPTTEWLLMEPSRKQNLCAYYLSALEKQKREYLYKPEEQVCSDHYAYGRGTVHFEVSIFGTDLSAKIWYQPEEKLVGFSIIVEREQLTEDLTYKLLNQMPSSYTQANHFLQGTRTDFCFTIPEKNLSDTLMHDEDSIGEQYQMASRKIIVIGKNFIVKMEEELHKLGVPVKQIMPIPYASEFVK